MPKKEAITVTYSIPSVDNDERFCDTVLYENADGERFLVFAFDAMFTNESRWRSYTMQKLLFDSVEWLGRKALPVRCEGNPDLYVICSSNDEGMSIGLWNFCLDSIDEPKIYLGDDYKNSEFVNCSGSLENRKISLSSLEAYSFAFVELKK